MATHSPLHVAEIDAELPEPSMSYRSRHFFKTFLSICVEISLDLSSIFLGTLTGFLCYQILPWGGHPLAAIYPNVFKFSTHYGFFFVLLMRGYHGYDQAHSLLNVRETERILRSSFNSLILYAATVYLVGIVVPLHLLVLCWVWITIFILAQRHTTYSWLARWKAKYARKTRVLIYGSGKEARRLYSSLLQSPHLGLVPIAFVDEDDHSGERVVFSHDYKHKASVPVFTRQLTCELLQELKAQSLFIAKPSASPQRVSEILALAAQHSIEISYLGTTQYHSHERPTSVRVIDGLLITSYVTSKGDTIVYPFLKRSLDLFVSIFLLLLTLPCWIAIAAWIKSTSEGPILFRQQRIGRGGKPFELLKFRSMYVDAPKFAESPKDSSDPRITRPGRFLRKSSLDELPQLLNVLMGNMTLVGPRPEMPYIVAGYTAIEQERLAVSQGLTGIWQLSADRKYAIHESLEYDLYYIEHRSFCLDVAVLIHTAIFAAQGI